MKKRIANIVFWLSFLPYIILLALGIWHAIFGFTFFAVTYTGWEGFYNSVFMLGWACCVICPILPVCLVYQIAYMVYVIIKKRKDIKK